VLPSLFFTFAIDGLLSWAAYLTIQVTAPGIHRRRLCDKQSSRLLLGDCLRPPEFACRSCSCDVTACALGCFIFFILLFWLASVAFSSYTSTSEGQLPIVAAAGLYRRQISTRLLIRLHLADCFREHAIQNLHRTRISVIVLHKVRLPDIDGSDNHQNACS